MKRLTLAKIEAMERLTLHRIATSLLLPSFGRVFVCSCVSASASVSVRVVFMQHVQLFIQHGPMQHGPMQHGHTACTS